MEEKSFFIQEEIKTQKENPIWVQEEPLVTQGKIKVLKEEESTMVQEEAREENEKEIESKASLEVVLSSVSQIHSCALHYPNLGAKVNITKSKLYFHSQ